MYWKRRKKNIDDTPKGVGQPYADILPERAKDRYMMRYNYVSQSRKHTHLGMMDVVANAPCPARLRRVRGRTRCMPGWSGTIGS